MTFKNHKIEDCGKYYTVVLPDGYIWCDIYATIEKAKQAITEEIIPLGYLSNKNQ